MDESKMISTETPQRFGENIDPHEIINKTEENKNNYAFKEKTIMCCDICGFYG